MQRRRRSWLANTIILLLGVFVLAPIQSEACGPGRAGGRRRMLRKYSPLVWRQYIPNVSEDTQGASGLPEGTIRRTDRRFKELVQNWNPDIVFRDDEKTGADRMMSQRLKERLSVLAISVMNQWPNVKLRVIEGWDEDHVHGPKSLHYEGRAVDITTSDKDQSKYGMLARLAIEAGFDWTHYESRSHVHCSVKSERADAVRNNGCFDAESLVETPYGQMEMSQLQKNDLVLTMEPQTGQLQFSPIIMWLDRDQVEQDLFVELRTKSGRSIRLTSSHLIYVADEEPMEDGANQQQNSHNNSNRVVDLTTSDVSPQTEASIQPPTTGHEQANAHKSNQDEQNYNKYYYDIRSDSSKVAKLKYSDKLAKSKQTRSGAVSEKCDDSGDVPSASYGDRQESRPRGRLTTTLDAVYTTYARNVVVGQYLLIDSATSSETGEPQQRSPQATDIRFAPHIYSLLSQMSRANNRQETRLKSTEYTNQILIDSTQQTLSHMKHEGDGDIQEPGEEYIEGQTLADSATTKITEGKAELDQVLEIHYVPSHGIYAPLTREGNIVVNSVVASCYAVISEHEMAHMSFAPVRWLSYLNEWLFGLRPETSQSSRTVRAIEKASSKQPLRVPYDQYSNPTTIHPGDNQKMLRFGANQSQRLDETSDDQRQIHWYPRMLYAIARFMLPNRYLY